MSRKFFRAGALALAVSACASTDDWRPASVAEATDGQGSPAIWMVADDDTTIYLMGTVHLINEDAQWRSELFERTWAESDTVFFEADAASPEAQAQMQGLVQRYGLNPPGVTLASYYTEEEVAELNQAIAPLNLSVAQLAPLRPWLANIQIGGLAVVNAGASPEAGADVVLGREASKLGKTLRYFETLDEQFQILSGAEDEAVAAFLLATAEDQILNTEAYFSALLSAWFEGRPDRLATLLNEGIGDYPDVAERFIYSRNQQWAEELDTLIDDEAGVFFVAVGAFHLAGDGSVQDELRKRGHRARRLRN